MSSISLTSSLGNGPFCKRSCVSSRRRNPNQSAVTGWLHQINSLLLLWPPNHKSKLSMTTATTHWFKIIELSLIIKTSHNLPAQTLMSNASDWFIKGIKTNQSLVEGQSGCHKSCVWHHSQNSQVIYSKCILSEQKCDFSIQKPLPNQMSSAINDYFNSTIYWRCLPKWLVDKYNSPSVFSPQRM